MGTDAAQSTRVVHFDGVNCHMRIEQHGQRVFVLRISGTDVGEFADAPMKALDDWLTASRAIDLFIDAQDVRGASIEVSGEWAAWLTARKGSWKTVTMLTGSRFIKLTAEFVRRFAKLEGIMRICTEPAVFEDALTEALSAQLLSNVDVEFRN